MTVHHMVLKNPAKEKNNKTGKSPTSVYLKEAFCCCCCCCYLKGNFLFDNKDKHVRDEERSIIISIFSIHLSSFSLL